MWDTTLPAAPATGFFVGVGAMGAGLAFAAAQAIVVCAIAVAVGDEKTVSDVSRATDELLPLMSPGVLTLMPVSPFVTPHDPTLFARGAGPALDLLTGVLSPKALDRIGRVRRVWLACHHGERT